MTTHFWEAVIAVALLATVAAITTITIISGSTELGPTGLHDLAILLGGALAGVSVAKKTPPDG